MRVTRDHVVAALTHFEAELATFGWNLRHALLHLYEDDDGRVSLAAVPFPEQVMAQSRPYLILAHWTECLRQGLIPFPGAAERWIGAALVFEAWLLEAGADAEVPLDEAEAVNSHRLIHAHPHSVEVRQILAVDEDEHLYVLNRVRGDEKGLVLYEDAAEHSGLAVDVLTEMVQYLAQVKRERCLK